jgi:NAD(P)H-dependent FMN reductase
MKSTAVISVIVGSIRERRFSEKPARWILEHLKKRGDVDAGLAELEAPARTMIDDLLWWTAALKAARASAS